MGLLFLKRKPRVWPCLKGKPNLRLPALRFWPPLKKQI
jgi:hypothetical protein